MKIKDAIQTILESNPDLSKYRLAKQLGVEPISIDNWIKRDTLSPKFEACRAIYKYYRIIVSPYLEEELKTGHEQLLMELEDELRVK